MKKHTIIAKLYNGKHEAVKEIPLCNVMLDEGRMSAERYNRLKRQLDKAVSPAPKAHYWHLETEGGLHDTFGGYPAEHNVRFGAKVDTHKEREEQLIAKSTKYKVITTEGEHAAPTVKELVPYAAGKTVIAVEKRDQFGREYAPHDGSKLRLMELLNN